MSEDAKQIRDKEENVARERANLLRVSYTDTRTMADEAFFPDLLTLQEIDQYQVIPVAADIQRIQFGFSLHTPQASLEQLQEKFPEYRVFFTYISKSGYDQLYQRYVEYAHKDEPAPPSPEELADQLANKILEVNSQVRSSGEINLFDEAFGQTQQSELFVFLTQQAYLLESSDIHIEPEPNGARVRFRIDGRLHVVGHLSTDRDQVLLNDLQMRARIRWNADYPQTGSTKETLVNHDKQQIEVNMRVETVPTLHGSDVVVRIFHMEEAYLKLDNLGLNQQQHQTIDEIISRPHGLTLLVGPTGSGKSSTQYAILNELNSTEVKIVTLEDPVEYEISGITQIPVKTDDADTFMNKLRAVMREDPDIIMIGEIRDEETARTALQASLTGHLVLSTFHASTGAAAVSRLLDLVDHNPLLISAVRLIMPQRLVRRLCPHCKESYTPEDNVAEIIARALQGLKQQPSEITLYKANGCDKCHHIGYQGRIIVVEQFQITESISNEIASNHDITVRRLQELAIQDGMITMLQDGILKALQGETTIEEIFRVVDIR